MSSNLARLGLACVLAVAIGLALAAPALAIPPFVNYSLVATGNTAPTDQVPEPPYHWYNVPVSLYLYDISWDAPGMEGRYDITSVYYTQDSGPQISVFPTSTVTLTQDGSYLVSCQGTWGGSAYPIYLGIDQSPPQLDLDAEVAYAESATIEASALDGLSGLDHIEMRLDSGAWQSVTRVSTSQVGTHTVSARAYDFTGNEVVVTAMFTVLPPPPLVTTTTLAGPSGVSGKQPLLLTGAVSPAAAPGTVTINGQRLVGKKWKHATSVTVPVIGGAFTYTDAEPAKGEWRFVATYSGGSTDATTYGTSASETLFVNVH